MAKQPKAKAKPNVEDYSHKAELQWSLDSFKKIEDRHPALKPAISSIRRNIDLRLDPSYPRITMREQMDIMTEVNLIHQADSDMTHFKDKPDVQRKIVDRVNDIHPKL